MRKTEARDGKHRCKAYSKFFFYLRGGRVRTCHVSSSCNTSVISRRVNPRSTKAPPDCAAGQVHLPFAARALVRNRLFFDPQTGVALGEIPKPQCAFEMSMFNVSCNSHYFSQLAAFFIDPRAE